jgi:hypothetical protein
MHGGVSHSGEEPVWIAELPPLPEPEASMLLERRHAADGPFVSEMWAAPLDRIASSIFGQAW